MVADQQKMIDFSQARVLVVGDVMLDRYWLGETGRISPEAPVPVVHVQDVRERPGGAGNVALNVHALGAKVSLIGAVGDDKAGDSLAGRLSSAGIHCHFQVVSNVPTVTKLRVLSRNQQLIRLDFEDKNLEIDRQQLLAEYRAELMQADVVILSDYGKGVLQNAKEFIDLAIEAQVPVFVDPKSADFSVYQGATAITPNLKEFEAVVGACDDEGQLVEKAGELLMAHHIQFLLITRSEKGMTLVQRQHDEMHVPSQAQEVFDVTGAGDTVIATLAAAYASGLSPMDSVKIANTAAGISVAKLGAAVVSMPELRRALRSDKQNESGVLNEEQLLLAIEEAREKGQRIVMTNGCFDILHAGHIHYLTQAKALGDKLIVAVNDDASVMRLKGSSRPINSLQTRMTVLAGLSSVDWVVPFSEDTPQRIIERILPDVLVKGGDYEVEEIAGGAAVMANGGEVKILDFVEGQSTSAVIAQIHENKEQVS